ncbi:hypothetical protein AKAW_11073 [Aspergillus luchuensis IFO 4308]|nr:hypothetical protein AKAW_11073 [Aspergillus luchuensis IFO 4308]
MVSKLPSTSGLHWVDRFEQGWRVVSPPLEVNETTCPYKVPSPPDGRKANFQAVSGKGISTHENDASDRDAMSEVDSVVTNELPEHPNNVAITSTKTLTMLICEYVPLCDVPNPAAIHPQTVLICIFKSRKQSPLTKNYRKLEEQVKDQNQENNRLHRRVSSIYESVPRSHTKSRRSARYKDRESE